MTESIKENGKLQENDTNIKDLNDDYTWRIAWHNVAFLLTFNLMSLYAIYLVFTEAMWSTIIFAYVLAVAGNVGATAGAHRLWSHKAYKAKTPLKILLLIMFTMAYEGSVHQWVRDHRTHHKYCDTDADPHNSRRGFFFSHMGWLMLKKRPEVIEKGRTIHLGDVQNDPLLRIQRKYYMIWALIFCFIIPSYIPLLWGEKLSTAFYVAVALRQTVGAHGIMAINSAAHMFGTRPYDKDICPTENKIVSLVAAGEGFHNYHHTFPWDYRAAELGGYWFNASRLFIDIMAKIGWAYDLKTVTEELIEKRAMSSGDGTHPVWGWGDKDLSAEYRNAAKIL